MIAAELKATLAIPANGPWFEGHFPGRPILPGVAELALAIAALRQETGKPLPLRGIAFARLRHLVLPGDRLELSARESAAAARETNRLRFDLKREAVLVANGEFIVGTPLPAEAAQPAVAYGARGDSGTAPEALLPHQPPMRFLTSILGQDAQTLDGIARIPDRCALVAHGSAPAIVAIEAAAQAAAAWAALGRRRQQGDAAPRVGYLVAMRDVNFFTDRIPADQTLRVSINLEAASPPLTQYRFEVSLEGSLLARGSIGTFLAE